MRKINSIIVTIIIMGTLLGCASQEKSPTQFAKHMINREKVTKTTHDTYPTKNPQTVSIYTNDNIPHAAYRVIGMAKVSKYNLFGKKRQDETVHTMMKTLAASIGGDGLIDIQHSENHIQAKIIAYQRILL